MIMLTVIPVQEKFARITSARFLSLLIHVQMALKTEEDVVMQELLEEVLQRPHQVLQ